MAGITRRTFVRAVPTAAVTATLGSRRPGRGARSVYRDGIEVAVAVDGPTASTLTRNVSGAEPPRSMYRVAGMDGIHRLDSSRTVATAVDRRTATALVASLNDAYSRGRRAATPVVSMGFNWPNAVNVYVNGWNQQSVLASDPSRPFRTARASGATVMRTMFGNDVSIGAVRVDSGTAYAKLGRILGDAAANGVRLVLSNYLTQDTIQAIAQRTYPSWAAAQIDLTTPGSPAWRAFTTWITTTVTRFRGNPGVYSWEVTNEAGWMLGMDAGTISVDTGFAFIDHFQALIRSLGGRVNQGGRPSYDMAALTDAQVVTMVRNLDILDDHIYPDYTSSGAPIDDRPAALERINLITDLQSRAAHLGHPLPVMLGEYGTLTGGWFDYVTQQATQRGWLVLPWGFDSYDQFAFNETTNTHVLATVKQS